MLGIVVYSCPARQDLKKEDAMRTRSRSATPVMVFLAIAALGMAPATLAEEQCSLASAAGDWVYTVTALDNPGGPPTSVGSFHLDRDGHLRGTQDLSIDGSTLRGEILTGTMTVNSDCTGSTVIVVSNTPYPRTADLDIAFENGSTELHSVFLTDAAEFNSVVDADLAFAAEGKRISRGND